MYFLFNLALWLAAPLLFLWVLYRNLCGRLPGLSQRLGLFAWKGFPPGTPVVWLHAVSVGEVKAATALVAALRKRDSTVRFVMTSSTAAGWTAARQFLTAEDMVLFPPFDVPFICRLFLRRIRPSAVVILETELWPNLFRETKRFGALLLLANGRISDRSHPRYLATRFFWRHVLRLPDHFFVQSSLDASRFESIGAPAEKIHVAGNLKFASRPGPSPIVKSLRTLFRGSGDTVAGPVIVAGSTMPGEEIFLLESFLQLLPEFPRLWMVLAPRHPNRFAAVTEQVRSLGIPVQLRSQWTAATHPLLPGVMILDCIGELGAMYELATVTYVGGTLVPTGGHNILEPAYFGRPIVIGPCMTNFHEIAEEFLQDSGVGQVASGDDIPSGARTGAIVQIPDASALTPVFRFLFRDSAFRRRLGDAAHERWTCNLSGVAPVIAAMQEKLAGAAALTEKKDRICSDEVVGARRVP